MPTNPPYLMEEAVQVISRHGVEHLLWISFLWTEKMMTEHFGHKTSGITMEKRRFQAYITEVVFVTNSI